MLKLSSHLRLVSQLVSSLQVFRLKFCMHFSPLKWVLCSIHFTLNLDYPKIFVEKFKLWNSSLRDFLWTPVIFSLSLSTLLPLLRPSVLSKHAVLRYSHSMALLLCERDQLSHPNTRAGNIDQVTSRIKFRQVTSLLTCLVYTSICVNVKLSLRLSNTP